jgi:hypothetical protein
LNSIARFANQISQLNKNNGASHVTLATRSQLPIL